MNRGKRIANILTESLPYIRELHGQSVVIKHGGHAMKDEWLNENFASAMVLLKYMGVHPVVVHGGGPQIGQLLAKLGITSEFRQGLRVTDQATMDVVEMVLVGRVNKEIVNRINLAGGRAVGLSGKDGRLILARKLEIVIDKKNIPTEIIDLGKVGEVVAVEQILIHSLQRDNFIPVIAPIGVDEAGETYNINADSVAGAVAAAIGAKRLILLTDVPGVLDKEGRRISSFTMSQAAIALEDGTCTGGMIPKIKCCLKALDDGVEKAHIIDGRVANSVLLELFTLFGIGTEIISRH
ncbi:Acetylglutamate kinase [Desulfovibrionales bacterium]